MKETGGMKLDELHVRDLDTRAPRHGHAVSSRDVRVCRVQINFPATAGCQHDPIRRDCFYVTGFFVQDIDSEAAVFCRETEFGCRDQVHGHVIFQ